MINIRTIRKLVNNDGLTLKAGKIISYKPVGKLLTMELKHIRLRKPLKLFAVWKEIAESG